jgi:NADPH-dependent 2,4-dienoyl-CoA reductase/sulfur reductase-like enzyme/rhodanese-related sulfurtransferase
MPKKILIIGGVAGGATAAARLRRLDENAEITILERGPYVSFANCGLPYFLSGDITKRSQLLLQTPEGFWSRYHVNVLTKTEAVEIRRKDHVVKARGPEGELELHYDALLLTQGSNPIVPPLPGVDQEHVFKLWTIPDMDRIQKYLVDKKPQTAVIAGGGFIGLEMAEAFHQRGIKTTIVELAPQIMATMDKEFAAAAQSALENDGVGVKTGLGLASIAAQTVQLSDGSSIPADLVLLSVGVRSELTLAKATGLEIGSAGGLVVDEFLRTSDPSIWAAGDMIETLNLVSGKKARIPLAGPANRQGRLAATNIVASYNPEVSSRPYRGALGSSVVKIFSYTAASAGLTERVAREAGLNVGTSTVHKGHHASYYPGAQTLSLKLVWERPTGRLLGAQAFGKEGVDKRIDALSMALSGKLTVHDLAEADFSYAPPYSSANDPINMAAFSAQNDLEAVCPLVAPDALLARGGDESEVLLDVRTLGDRSKGHAAASLHVPMDELRDRVAELPRNKKIHVYCKDGFLGYLAVRILKQNGFEADNIAGGWTSMVRCGWKENV